MYKKTTSFLILSSILTSGFAQASPYPDSGTIYREFKDGSFRKIEPLPPRPVQKLEAKPHLPDNGATVHVTGFAVHGNTQLTSSQINAVLKPFTRKTLTNSQLHDAADALVKKYHQQGLFAAKVFIPPQSIDKGVVELRVYEGVLDTNGILLSNSGERVTNPIIEDILRTNLREGEVIFTDDIERAILLVDDLPGIHSDATLYPGTEVGTAKIHVKTIDEKQVYGNIDFDNFGGYYTGENRLGGTIYINSPTQSGDQVTARLVTSGSDSNYGYLRYDMPVSGNGMRVGVSADYLDYALSKQFSALGSAGDVTELRVFMTHPYIRTRHTNFNWGLDYVHLKLDDHDDQGDLAERTINSGVIRLNGDHDDDLYAAGTSYYSIDLTLGDLSIDGNDTYITFDDANAKTAGSFSKINFAVSRLQHLKGQLSSLIFLSGQVADGNLDTSQKMYIGGPFSVPGYPTGEASGDDAVVLHLDLRHDYYNQPWGGVLQASVFYTYGKATLYKDSFPNFQVVNQGFPNRVTLQSMGFGVNQTWPEGIVVRAMLGWQLGDNDNEDPASGADSDNSDKDYRAWVQGIYYF